MKPRVLNPPPANISRKTNCCGKIERFLEQVRKQKWEESDSGFHFRGVSAGYSAFPGDSRDVEKLLTMADRRMYEEKKAKEGNR